MPALLRIGLWLSVVIAAVFVLALALFAAMISLVDAWPLGDRTVSRAEFLAATWPTLSILPVATAFVVAIAWGVWKERAWARPVMIAYTLSATAWVAVVGLWTGEPFATSFAMDVGLAAFTAWYLYRKQSVVAYYNALRARHRAA